MNETIKKAITEAGLVISLITVGGVGGYFVSDKIVTEPVIVEKPVFNWWGDEGKVIIDVYNAMLAEKKENCATETDCIVDNGVPKIVFEGIKQDEIPNKLNEKLKDYDIIIKKK